LLLLREILQVRVHHADDGGKDLFAHHTSIQGSGYKSLKRARRSLSR